MQWPESIKRLYSDVRRWFAVGDGLNLRFDFLAFILSMFFITVVFGGFLGRVVTVC